MDIIEYREFCLSLPYAEETMPFGEDVLVFKVEGKMFAYNRIDNFKMVGVKCDPEYAIELKERHAEITTTPHMNKKHWIGIDMEGELSNRFIKQLIRDSHRLVALGLTKSKREKVLQAIQKVDCDLK